PHFVDTSFVLRESCGCPPGQPTRRLFDAEHALLDHRPRQGSDQRHGPVDGVAQALASGLALGAWSGAEAAGTLTRAAEAVTAALPAPRAPARPASEKPADEPSDQPFDQPFDQPADQPSDQRQRASLEQALTEVFQLDPRPEAAVGIAAW